MTGRILIVDGIATNRILMKVRLDASYYDTTLFASGAEVLAHLRVALPEILLIGTSLTDMQPAELCRLVRRLPGCMRLPILMQAGSADRLAALGAGATAVVDPAEAEPTLFARIRGLMRKSGDGVQLSSLIAAPAVGMAEETAAFVAPRPRCITLVCNQDDAALAWRQALQDELKMPICLRDPSHVLAQIRDADAPDVYLIFADIQQPGDGLRLLCELRARASSRSSGFLIVLDPARLDMTPVALDLGASDVLPSAFSTQTSAAEAAIRVRRELDNKLFEDGKRRETQRNLQWAMTDPLTGLHNRRYAMPRLDEMIAQSGADSGCLAVLILDVDYFKRINDRFGHVAGDAVLSQLAARLGAILPDKTLLARIGGEEFLIALTVPDLATLQKQAEQIRATIAGETFRAANRGLNITASIGVTLLCGGAAASLPSSEQLLLRADWALLRAKSMGRNKVVHASSAPVV